MARRFFAPVAAFLIPDKEGGKINVVAVNDSGADVNVSADLTTVTLDGENRPIHFDTPTPAPSPQGVRRMEAAVGQDAARLLGTVPLEAIPAGSFLFLDWKGSDGSSGSSHFSPLPYKAHRLEAPGLGLEISGENRVTITARKPAFHVVAESAVVGHFSDNAFDVLPGRPVTITFTPERPGRLTSDTFILRDLHSSYTSRSI